MFQGPLSESQRAIEKKSEAIKTSSIIVEPVNAVLAKCLKKALTPPVTIKNFFKPAAKTSPLTSQDGDADLQEAASNQGGTESKGSEVNLSLSNKDKEGATAGIGSKDEAEQWNSREVASSPAPTRTPKRQNESCESPQPAKKSRVGKQINIMASFAKQKSIQEEKETRSIACPICNKQFDAGTPNSVVNKHIDSCLID